MVSNLLDINQSELENVVSKMERSDDTIIVQMESFRKEEETRVNLAVDELRKELQDKFSARNLAMLSIDWIEECYRVDGAGKSERIPELSYAEEGTFVAGHETGNAWFIDRWDVIHCRVIAIRK